jgi:2-polyprenyl-6-hydroxyphenyl methylase/3-demethylubiquinone-9 3-methyltransferase
VEPDKVECKRKFDVVLALEVVEHVSDLSAFLCQPDGGLRSASMLFCLHHRPHLESFVFAIIGAECDAARVARGTHR